MSGSLISLVVPCHNSGAAALEVVREIGALPKPKGYMLEAIVIDDASTDESASHLRSGLPSWARLIELAENAGRSGARNVGIEQARGDVLLLMDSDCIPLNVDFLIAHFDTLAQSADASVGDILGNGEGFWGRYQSRVGGRRARAARRGRTLLNLTTANILVRRDAVRAIGGFDPRYRHYGFEDRDFLLRLQRTGAHIRHAPDAPALHAARLDLPAICRKMHEGGRYNGALFRTDYPAAYKELGYAAIDAALHPLRARLLAPIARKAIANSRAIERWLLDSIYPFGIRAGVARWVTALAYLEGSRLATKDRTLVGKCPPSPPV